MSSAAASAKIHFISAGAGSGKTYRLTQLLQDMLVDGHVAPAGVIATTFTKKAAAELRERVRSHLLASGQPALAVAIGQARIGTVNSVCGALLARFAFEAGQPTEQRVLDEEAAKQVLQESIDEVIEESALEGLLSVARGLGLDRPRHGQKVESWRLALGEIVDHARANAIDSGELRAFGRANAERLLSHFPAVVSEDLDSRLHRAIEAARTDIRAATAGAEPKKVTGDYLRCLDEVLQDMRAGELRWAQWSKLASAAPEARLRALAQPVTDAAAKHPQHPTLHADLRSYLTALFEIAANALEGYARRKRQMRAVDFADQERLLLDVLEEPDVAASLREELDLLMIDEFQDTSPIQLALFLKLAGLAEHVICVGDLKQAIYGFRGGDAALMQAVLATLPALGADKEILARSYRSRPPLVALVNDVFGTAFPGASVEEVALTAERKEIDGATAVEDWLLEGNAQERCQAVASGIAALVGEGGRIQDPATRELRPMRFADIAVLARSNQAVRDIAAALGARDIPSSTAQPGLLAQPETVLALACVRRLNDERDTLASAEIVSLAQCEDPDQWLAHRLAWIDAGSNPSQWRETGSDAAPLLGAIQALRAQRPLLSPREAVEMILQQCGLSRCVLQWQGSAQRARLRLANLDRLVGCAAQYEEGCRTGGQAATLSGLLLWLQNLAADGLDTLPQPGVDAVQILTHHAAKGLEWPVVVLLGLEGDIKDAVWDQVRPEPLTQFDARAPLEGRFLRYWPWPYGEQKKVPIGEIILASAEGAAIRRAAVEEHKRLLYVSLTRARDLLVLARAEKSHDGEWMQTVSLAQRLPAADAADIELSDGTRGKFRRRRLNAAAAQCAAAAADANLTWFHPAAAVSVKPPLMVSPSAAASGGARVVERCRVGTRIKTASDDSSALGEALHACIAADLVAEAGLSVEEIEAILERMAVRGAVTGADVARQVTSLRQWLKERWPAARWLVEVPVTQVLDGGQRMAGRIDLLLRTEGGWILIDHKSSAQGSEQWEGLAEKHGGQLAAYSAAVAAVTGRPVQETWLLLPVAAAALRLVFEGAAPIPAN